MSGAAVAVDAQAHAHAGADHDEHAAGLSERGSGGGRAGAGDARDSDHASSKRVVVAYGFWIFLISDIILFAAFFAAYAVLSQGMFDGPVGRDLFELDSVAWETALLLTSSLTCGIAGIGAQARIGWLFHAAMAATFALGAGFLGLEIREFAGLIEQGAGPQANAWWSSFFALVGCHGLHVTAGLLWLLTMMAQVVAKGWRDDIQRRLLCFALFWHTLDIVWVGLFGLVYLVELSKA